MLSCFRIFYLLVALKPFVAHRYLHHQSEEDLGKAAPGSSCHCCHWEPSWCQRHFFQEHWTGMDIRKPAVLGAGLPRHASLPASDSLLIIGNNTRYNYRNAFCTHGLCVALGSLKQMSWNPLPISGHLITCFSSISFFLLDFYHINGQSPSPRTAVCNWYWFSGGGKHLIWKVSKKKFAVIEQGMVTGIFVILTPKL